MITILGIKVIDRIKEAGLTQEVLTAHSSVITTRLGFHELTDEVCSREAYIIIHLNGSPDDIKRDLKNIGGIEIREMIFNGSQDDGKTPVIGDVEIIGILVKKEKEVVQSVQKVLTSFGCSIRTRLGVNEMFFGQPSGLIILELKGDNKQRELLEKDLKALSDVHVRKMIFS